MVIVGVTDVHGDIGCVEAISGELRAADCVLLGGDLTHFGQTAAVERVLKAFRKYNDRLFAVAGNCDYPAVEQHLDALGVNLHGRSITHNRVAFVGVGGATPGPTQTPNEITEKQVQDTLAACGAQLTSDCPTVLVSHNPPLNTCMDKVGPGMHVGSEAVRSFIDRHKPLLCLTGHIHEATGLERLGDSVVVNPGPFAQGYYLRAEVAGSTLVDVALRRVGHVD